MGSSGGGLTRKNHAPVDAEDRPVCLELTAGQAGDGPAAESCSKGSSGATPDPDRAYDTDAVRGAWANIPPCSIRKRAFGFSG